MVFVVSFSAISAIVWIKGWINWDSLVLSGDWFEVIIIIDSSIWMMAFLVLWDNCRVVSLLMMSSLVIVFTDVLINLSIVSLIISSILVLVTITVVVNLSAYGFPGFIFSYLGFVASVVVLLFLSLLFALYIIFVVGLFLGSSLL